MRRQGAHHRALRVEVEHPRAGGESGDHQHGGAGLPRAGECGQGGVSVAQARLELGGRRAAEWLGPERRRRFEGAGKIRRGGAVVLQPVEHRGRGGAPGAVEPGTRRERPERIVDASRKLVVARAGIRARVPRIHARAPGMQSLDGPHRLSGVLAGQTGEVGQRACRGPRVLGGPHLAHGRRDRFDPRAERGRERRSEVAEPSLNVRVADDLVDRSQKRVKSGLRTPAAFTPRTVVRRTHRSAREPVMTGPAHWCSDLSLPAEPVLDDVVHHRRLGQRRGVAEVVDLVRRDLAQYAGA